VEPFRFQKQTPRTNAPIHSLSEQQARSAPSLESIENRSQIIIELREQFSRLTGAKLPATLTELEKTDLELEERLAAISRAQTILNDDQTRWYEPIRTGWITNSAQLSLVMRRNPLVYYPLRVVSELIQPLNILTINLIVSTSRIVGAGHANPPATTAPEISIPVFIGGSIIAALSLTTFYRYLARMNQGLSEGLSNPNAIAGSLTAKANDLVDNVHLVALKQGKNAPINDPELAAHAALRWDKDPEIRMAKIAEIRHALHARDLEIREAREILDMHRHLALAGEDFARNARDLGFARVSPDEAIAMLAAALISAPEGLRDRVVEWLYPYTAVAEESRVLTPVAPDFLKAGRFANADMVRSWKLFVHALNTYERPRRVGVIMAVIDAVEELRELEGAL